MNLFRLCGDVSHVVSIVVLALRLNATKSAVGIYGSYLAYFCGFVQTLLYGDFFYYFSKAKATGSAVALPT